MEFLLNNLKYIVLKIILILKASKVSYFAGDFWRLLIAWFHWFLQEKREDYKSKSIDWKLIDPIVGKLSECCCRYYCQMTKTNIKQGCAIAVPGSLPTVLLQVE